MTELGLLQYATGWQEAWAFRAVAGLVGLLCSYALLRSFLGRASGWPYRVFILFLVVLGLLLALWPQQVVDLVIRTPYLDRVRILMGSISILVLLVTLESIRRSQLQERYALLWLATACVILTSALFPQTVGLFRMVTGMEYATALVAVAFTFLVMVAFHFSISFSYLRLKQAKVTQRLAILEERLRRLEETENSPTRASGAEEVDESEGHPS